MKMRKMKQQGFTLIELLVVIAIIAILASVSVPALQGAMERARMTKEMKQAKGIADGLRVYAQDTDGAYPYGNDANEAFAQMFPEFGEEGVFYVRGSAWHGSRGSRFADGPDEQFQDDSEDGGGGGQALEPGENHWAFNTEADVESKTTLPLIADGFSSQVGVYSRDKKELGGIWKGRRAIVINCGGSGQIVKLSPDMRYINKKANNRDEFRQNGVQMVNPAQPPG